MIAGGIGITPMLSMLRYMSDVGDERHITLIWSNRTREDIVYGHEFEDIKNGLKHLSIIHVLSRESPKGVMGGQLDRKKLETLLAQCDRQSVIFVCGPPLMMQEIKRVLPRLGFSRRMIFSEEFAL